MNDCLYFNIYNEIKNRIVSGKLQNGERIPTEKEIVDTYGVSRITATKAVQKLESESLVKRVKGSGTFVSYNDVSTFGNYRFSLNTRSKNIAFVAPCKIPFVVSILADFQKIAIAHGYNVSIFDTARNCSIETNVLSSLNPEDFCGIIFKPTSTFNTIGELYKIVKNNTPFIFLDSNIPMIKAPCVKSNNYLGGYRITKKLIEYGHTNIAVVFSDMSNLNEQERFGGYLRALMEYDIQFKPENIYYYDSGSAPVVHNVNMHSPIALNNNLGALITRKDPPTACFCFHDMLASYIEQMAFEAGYKIPDKFSIAGYDNSLICTQMLTPITSVDQNYHAIAEKTFNLLLDMISGKTFCLENLIEPTVELRESISKLR